MAKWHAGTDHHILYGVYFQRGHNFLTCAICINGLLYLYSWSQWSKCFISLNELLNDMQVAINMLCKFLYTFSKTSCLMTNLLSWPDYYHPQATIMHSSILLDNVSNKIISKFTFCGSAVKFLVPVSNLWHWCIVLSRFILVSMCEIIFHHSYGPIVISDCFQVL